MGASGAEAVKLWLVLRFGACCVGLGWGEDCFQAMLRSSSTGGLAVRSATIQGETQNGAALSMLSHGLRFCSPEFVAPLGRTSPVAAPRNSLLLRCRSDFDRLGSGELPLPFLFDMR